MGQKISEMTKLIVFIFYKTISQKTPKKLQNLDKKRQTQETLFSNACFASGSFANPIIFARSARFPLPQIMRLPASFLQVGSRVELIVREEANRGTPHTITENGAFPPPPSPPQPRTPPIKHVQHLSPRFPSPLRNKGGLCYGQAYDGPCIPELSYFRGSGFGFSYRSPAPTLSLQDSLTSGGCFFYHSWQALPL